MIMNTKYMKKLEVVPFFIGSGFVKFVAFLVGCGFIKFSAFLVGCGFAAALTSCEDMFETESDRQIFDPSLDAKTDSMFYTLGILKGLQQVADQYVMTGEMRGDLVATNKYTETDLRRLADFTADATNRFDSAYLYYRVINNCNYYIAHRDTALRTGSRRVAIPEYAEAMAVRAWAYMQLAKNYGSVPFYTDPLTSIGDANSQMESKDLQGICDALAPGLMQFSGTPVPTYGEINAGVLNTSSSDNPEEKRVQSLRAMLPVDLVLGDLFLETHQYEQAAKYYFKFLNDNKWQIRQAYILPTDRYFTLLFRDNLPSSFSMTVSGYEWSSIFSVTSTNDIITYIPMAANKLRGLTTGLPRYFGYDLYSTTGGDASSTTRYLLERQIDASPSYVALSGAQDYYYTPSGSTGANIEVRTLPWGDLRRYATMRPVAKNDSSFAVMIKFNSANIPVYRTAMVYLRLAEAINRMGYPDAAFAILKDGISDDLFDYVQKGDSTDLKVKGRYIRPATAQFLSTTVPFLSDENVENFANNWGIHSRGTYYTRGSFSPYQMDTIVGMKIAELQQQMGIVPTGTLNDTINAVEDLLCDEMALELAFEGNRFGDLTRLARHKNQAALYRSNYGSEWLASKLAYKNPAVSLLDEKNWYLPFK